MHLCPKLAVGCMSKMTQQITGSSLADASSWSEIMGLIRTCALQDADSLAHYNIGPETMLSLAVRERGGRKK